MQFLFKTSLIALALLATSCAESPTGRPQLMLTDAAQVNSLGVQSFAELKEKTPITKQEKASQYVQCVAKAVIAVTPSKYQQTAWEIEVFEGDEVNAFALPGGKIGVYSGLLLVAENQNQLAAVIGHEIAHVMAEHARERMSSNQVIQTALGVTDVALNAMSTNYKKEISGALGLGAQVGIALPFSRIHESEADVIGLELMAKAGFDPQQSVNLWQNMAKQSGKAPLQLLSTHPVPATRIATLERNMPSALKYYEERKNQGKLPSCNR